ncbi:MAG: hypothetical protein QOE11_258 [Solirubrobacteraceae bacterium]|jgi:hypothetical protein|nr:hypothetical protein [Solirubrobacteraceae bacterium]
MDISGFAGVEVLVGLSFVFFLLSTACSAVQETLASILGWRAKTLEDAVGNLLGNPKVKRGFKEWFGRVDKRGVGADVAQIHAQAAWPADMTSQVFEHWRIRGLVRDPDSSLRRRSRPSYLPPRALSLAVAETLAAHSPGPGEQDAAPSPWAQKDAEIFAGIEKALARMPLEHPREILQKAAGNADGELERFRGHIEHAFNDGMERASGWYKRKAQLVLAIVGLVFAVGLNVDTVRIAAHLYNDEAVRTAVVSKVDTSAKSDASAAQKAADSVTKVQQLQLPVGWAAANRPSGLMGWLSRIPGWLITVAALNLGAPFWFDLLSRLSRQRQAGTPEEPGRRLSDKSPKPATDIDSVPPVKD